MGTEIECLVEPIDESVTASALDAVEAEFRRLEALLSRFRPDSELSRLNERGQAQVGPELLEVTLLALVARRSTQGRFDPTVHDALVSAGYDRSFERICRDRPASRNRAACGGQVEVDLARRRIVLEQGFRLDLGGIAKGWAADRACRILADAGPCLINAGGDLVVSGYPRSGLWPVGIETPGRALTIGLTRGAIATSGRDRRTWSCGNELSHHLIDPRTGAPSASDLERVTVVAATATEAEVLATSLFLAGSAAASREADDSGLAAVLVTRDGRTLLSEALR